MAKPHQSKPVLLLAQPALIADSRNVVRAKAASPSGAGSATGLTHAAGSAVAAGAGASSVLLKGFLLWDLRRPDLSGSRPRGRAGARMDGRKHGWPAAPGWLPGGKPSLWPTQERMA